MIVSVGRPVPGFRLRIVDSGGRGLRDLPAGTVGQVWIQGPSLMDGYLGDPEATARTLRDGVRDRFGVSLEPEARLVGLTL